MLDDFLAAVWKHGEGPRVLAVVSACGVAREGTQGTLLGAPDGVLLLIGFALFEQLIGHLLMAGEPGPLEDRGLIPIEAEPFQAVEDDLRVFVRGTGFVGVFDAEQKLPALAAGEEPVEESGAGAAHVQVAGRGWCESDSDGHRGE